MVSQSLRVNTRWLWKCFSTQPVVEIVLILELYEIAATQYCPLVAQEGGVKAASASDKLIATHGGGSAPITISCED